jgi:hypothetical protein
MTRIRNLHEKWLREPDSCHSYEALAPEFELARVDASYTMAVA